MTQDQKLDWLMEKFGALDDKVSALDDKVDALDDKVSALDRKVDSNYRELKSMDEAILDEVERVHLILMRHISDEKVHMA